MNWDLEIVKKVMDTKLTDHDKQYTIEMYVKGWWTKEQVKNLLRDWEEESKIIEIAKLIEFLANCEDNKKKTAAIKYDRDNGLLTRDEALDLAIYYCKN